MNLESGTIVAEFGVRSVKNNVESEEITRKKITTELAELGLVDCPAEIIDHLVILEQESHFNDDARAIIEGIKNVLELETSFKLNPEQRKQVFLAAYLGDIGKSYSLEVAELFSVENIKKREVVTVDKIIKKHFSNKEKVMIANLKKVGVTEKMTMLKLHDRHAYWTQEILEKHSSVIDRETRIIAASHHLDRGIDPCKIKSGDLWETSNEVRFSIYLLMAIDKYQASIVRGGKNHEEAIKSVKDAMRPFDGDGLKDMIIRTIEQLGATNGVFPEGYVSSRHK